MSNQQHYYAVRQPRNENSRNYADRHREPWSDSELDIIRQRWMNVDPSLRDEAAIAAELGRTIEACRNRAEILRGSRPKGGGKTDQSRLAREIRRPLVQVDDDDPLKEWYA